MGIGLESSWDIQILAIVDLNMTHQQLALWSFSTFTSDLGQEGWRSQKILNNNKKHQTDFNFRKSFSFKSKLRLWSRLVTI